MYTSATTHKKLVEYALKFSVTLNLAYNSQQSSFHKVQFHCIVRCFLVMFWSNLPFCVHVFNLLKYCYNLFSELHNINGIQTCKTILKNWVWEKVKKMLYKNKCTLVCSKTYLRKGKAVLWTGFQLILSVYIVSIDTFLFLIWKHCNCCRVLSGKWMYWTILPQFSPSFWGKFCQPWDGILPFSSLYLILLWADFFLFLLAYGCLFHRVGGGVNFEIKHLNYPICVLSCFCSRDFCQLNRCLIIIPDSLICWVQ